MFMLLKMFPPASREEAKRTTLLDTAYPIRMWMAL